MGPISLECSNGEYGIEAYCGARRLYSRQKHAGPEMHCALKMLMVPHSTRARCSANGLGGASPNFAKVSTVFGLIRWEHNDRLIVNFIMCSFPNFYVIHTFLSAGSSMRAGPSVPSSHHCYLIRSFLYGHGHMTAHFLALRFC